MTGAQKLLARASGLARVNVGDVVYPDPALVIIHDGYVEAAYKELKALGYGAVRNPGRVMFVTDHEVAYGSQAAVARGAGNRDVAKRWNIGHMYDAG